MSSIPSHCRNNGVRLLFLSFQNWPPARRDRISAVTQPCAPPQIFRVDSLGRLGCPDKCAGRLTLSQSLRGADLPNVNRQKSISPTNRFDFCSHLLSVRKSFYAGLLAAGKMVTASVSTPQGGGSQSVESRTSTFTLFFAII